MAEIPGGRDRFWRLIAVVVAAAAAAVIASLAWAKVSGVTLTVHFALALSLGVGFSVLLAGALMALAFHNARSGHDDEVRDLMGDEERRD